MKNKPGKKLARLRQELKRRNVVRVITVYAAAAFVIMELVSIIVEPLRLPEWTLPLIIVLLCVGFIIAVILSWIYDLTPAGIAKTGPVKENGGDTQPKSSGIIGWKVTTIISLLVIASLILLNIFKISGRSGDIRKLEKSIAVLPFYYYNMDPEAEDLGDAFSNEIITQLYKIKGFDRIISHTSTLSYKGADMPSIPIIGDELNVNFIIEGSLERQNENVLIQIQIVRADTDDHIWADEFKGEWKNIFEIRASIAKDVASELKTLLSENEIEQIEKQATDNLEAYDLYLLGNQYSQEATEESYLKAIEFYESAIELDPMFALAYVGIGDVYRSMFFRANWLPEIAYEKSREALLKALEIDDQLAETHYSLARVKYEYDFEFVAAEEEFKKAIELNPNLARAYVYYGDLQFLRGRLQEALELAKKAILLEPTSIHNKTILGFGYYLAGYPDSAIIRLNSLIQQYPDIETPKRFLGAVYLSTGEFQEAITMLEKTVEIDPVSQGGHMLLGIAYARAGMEEKTRKQLEVFNRQEKEGKSVSFPRALLLAELGKIDSAMYWLERSYREKCQWVIYLREYDYFFTTIRSDPRFIDFYNKIFPDDQ